MGQWCVHHQFVIRYNDRFQQVRDNVYQPLDGIISNVELHEFDGEREDRVNSGV